MLLVLSCSSVLFTDICAINIFLKHEEKLSRVASLRFSVMKSQHIPDMINVKSDITPILSLLLISSYDTQNTNTVLLNTLQNSQTK